MNYAEVVHERPGIFNYVCIKYRKVSNPEFLNISLAESVFLYKGPSCLQAVDNVLPILQSTRRNVLLFKVPGGSLQKCSDIAAAILKKKVEDYCVKMAGTSLCFNLKVGWTESINTR